MAGQIDNRRSSRLVLGLGCERGTDTSEVISLAEDALKRCGRSAGDVVLVTSIDKRADEPAVMEAARHFGVPLHVFPASLLETLTPRLATPSVIVFAYTGCHGVAEAAALAGGGEGAELIVPKLKSQKATVAIAESSQVLVGRRSDFESTTSEIDSSASPLLAEPRS
jgi:cobalt-precorrin 5A hydrolase